MPLRPFSAIAVLIGTLLTFADLPAASASPAQRGVQVERPNTLIEWDAARDGNPRVWRSGETTITLSTRRGDTGPVPVITVRAPGLPVFRHAGQAGLAEAAARFGVGRLDPAAAGPQILFSTFSGGAHCCTWLQLLEVSGGRWRVVDLGEWDSDGLSDFPTDVNGDGVADMVMGDNRFDYAFDSHAGSLMPPQIFNVRGGRFIDVSSDPSYRPVYQAALPEAEAGCREHGNGPCAAFVAIAARLGRAQRAWPIMLANYDNSPGWTYPTDCRIHLRAGQSCPDSQIITFRGMPQALSWFLRNTGYTRGLIAPIR